MIVPVEVLDRMSVQTPKIYTALVGVADKALDILNLAMNNDTKNTSSVLEGAAVGAASGALAGLFWNHRLNVADRDAGITDIDRPGARLLTIATTVLGLLAGSLIDRVATQYFGH